MENTLTQEQALSVLIQGIQIAQGKGAYTLEDASVLAKAVAVFKPAEVDGPSKEGEVVEAQAEATEEVVEEKPTPKLEVK